jgi:hypothetical protein
VLLQRGDCSKLRLEITAAATEAVRLGGGYAKYSELKLSCSQLWAKDGTHLSPLAKEVFLNTIQGDTNTVHSFKIFGISPITSGQYLGPDNFCCWK